MNIETLKDLKDILNKCPDELLESIYFGIPEGSIDVSFIAYEGNDKYSYPEIWDYVNKKYPELNDIEQLIKNLCQVQVLMYDKDDYDKGILDTITTENIDSDFFKRNKKEQSAQEKLTKE